MPASARVRPLSDAEAAALRRLERGTRDAVVRTRCLMLLQSHAGLTPRAIGRLLGRSPETVRRAIRRYEQAGLPGLADGRASGPPRRVNGAGRVRAREIVDDRAVDIGHELRSPLTTIIGFARLLASAPPGSLDPARQARFIAAIAEAGSYMLRLIDDLLDLRRLESGVEPLRSGTLQVAPFLQGALLGCQSRADEKSIATSLEVEPGLPPIVTDDLLARRAVENLLSNAVKYTPAGGSVRLTAARQGDGVAITVADTGIGLAEHERVRVFERFYRGSRPEARAEQGSGLGLALVWEVARRLGGEVRVTSHLGRGSAFTLWLPLRPPGAPASSEVSK